MLRSVRAYLSMEILQQFLGYYIRIGWDAERAIWHVNNGNQKVMVVRCGMALPFGASCHVAHTQVCGPDVFGPWS